MQLTVTYSSGDSKTHELTSDRFVIGREQDADLVLDDEQISRHHASFERQGDQIVVTDLGSRNGTFVNGRRISEATPVGDDDDIRVGTTRIRVTGAASAAGSTVAAPRPDETVAPSEAPAPPRPFPDRPGATPRSHTRLERLTLQRTAKRATLIAIIALLVAVAAITAGVLFATGVLPPGDDGLSTAEIISEVAPSTAIVRIAPPDGELVSSGTGWVLDAEEGLIVTNEHVVSGGTRFAVVLDEEERRAELIGAAPCEDLAVLRIEDVEGLEELELGSQSDLEQGDPVVAIGYPVNASARDSLVATTGVVSQVQTQWRLRDNPDLPRYPNLVQTDAVINPGNSGGPLVDSQARLVGVNSASIRGNIEQHYAVGVDRVMEITDVLREGRGIAWTGMGFNFEATERGIAVTSVVPGTPADAEGFGDFPIIVAAVNGERVDDLQSYCAAIGEQGQSGDSATFTIIPIENNQVGRVRDVRVAFH